MEYLPPRPNEGGEAEQRAEQIRANLHQDMHTTLTSQFIGTDALYDSDLVDRLVDDAMFRVEHLLIEIEALHIERRARDAGSVTEPVPTWGMD